MTEGVVNIEIRTKLLDEKTLKQLEKMKPDELTAYALNTFYDTKWVSTSGCQISITQTYDWNEYTYGNETYKFCNFERTTGRILYKDPQYTATKMTIIENCYGRRYSSPYPQYYVNTGNHDQNVTINYPSINQDYYLYDNESLWYDVAKFGSYCRSIVTVYLQRGGSSWSVSIDCTKGSPLL